MPIERLFLGWDAPLSSKVCAHLLPEAPSAPVDFSDTLIIVPTRQAGRRLREALARTCFASDSTLLSVRAVPPSILFVAAADGPRPASGALVKALWADVLLAADSSMLHGFCAAGEMDAAWALHTGEMLQRLRERLTEGGYRVGDVAVHMAEEIQEQERWEVMAGLEQAYLERVATAGFEDPCVARLRAAAAPELPVCVERIVVAGVPDLPRLAVQALETVSKSHHVQILIHAPADMAGAFDEWGRPDAEFWQDAQLEIPEAHENLFVAATPTDQGHRILEIMASEQERFGPADVAIGVPDSEVTPCVAELLARHGVDTFDPAEHALSSHPLIHVISLYADLVSDGTYAAVRRFLRNAEVLDCLLRDLEQSPARMLRQLDRFQNAFQPASLTDMLAVLKSKGDAAFPELTMAIKEMDRWRRAFVDTERMQDAVRSFLTSLYRGRSITVKSYDDALFCSVADAVDAVLHECDDLRTVTRITPRDGLRVLLQRLSEETYQPQRPDGVLELEGWLELPWNDAALLVVSGMNEGFVPDGRIGDAFLPDTLRVKLGLRHDAQRLARDAFMMRAMIASRMVQGRACFIVGKTSSAGDPLKPSRLLFRCPDDELACRAQRLFGAVKPSRPECARSVAFKLDPVIRDAAVEKRATGRELSVTAFRAYLACPFRFYLQRVLRMERVADDKQGLDALDFGTLLHAVLQDLVDDGMWRCEKVDELAQYLQDRASRRVNARYGRTLSLPLIVALDSARQRLAAVAEFQVGLVREGWEIELAEQKLEMQMGDFRVRGTIDRVDRHRDTGRLRIIDYKTSDNPVAPPTAHLASAGSESRSYALYDPAGRPRRWVDLQLPLYRLLLAASRGEDAAPELAYFNIPKAATMTGLECWEDFTGDHLDAARACAEGVLNDIAAGRYWPPADRLRYDDFEALVLGDPMATVSPVPPRDAEGVVR